LTKAGIEVRTVNVHPNHHDKVLIADGRHVQTGSFNYIKIAATKNSENVLVIWNNPALVERI